MFFESFGGKIFFPYLYADAALENIFYILSGDWLTSHLCSHMVVGDSNLRF